MAKRKMTKRQIDAAAKKLAGVFGAKAFEYKTVDTSTLKGLKQAERLKENGWKVISVGLFNIQFEREIKA